MVPRKRICHRYLLIAGKHQGKGFGSAFLEMIKEELVKKGIPTILLDTEEKMPAADFYKKNGFKPLTDNVTFLCVVLIAITQESHHSNCKCQIS